MRKASFKFEGTDPATSKKFKIVVDGWVPDPLMNAMKEEINKILVGESPAQEVKPNTPFVDVDSFTIKQKIELIILQNFKHGWFTTNDLMDQYDQRFKQKLKNTTAATNLQRLSLEDGILERKGSRNQLEYRLLLEKVKDRLDKLANVVLID